MAPENRYLGAWGLGKSRQITLLHIVAQPEFGTAQALSAQVSGSSPFDTRGCCNFGSIPKNPQQ